jgi:hypothetical protein
MKPLRVTMTLNKNDLEIMNLVDLHMSSFQQGKGKGHPITGHEGPRGGVEV